MVAAGIPARDSSIRRSLEDADPRWPRQPHQPGFPMGLQTEQSLSSVSTCSFFSCPTASRPLSILRREEVLLAANLGPLVP